MHPTLFTIGKFNVPTYTVLLDLGLILGLVLTYFEGKRLLKRGETALDLGLWSVIGGILGGRIGYVLVNWNVFRGDWGQAVRIWEGGLAFHGALVGGLLVLVIMSLLQRRSEAPISFWGLADVVTPGLALGLTFGWAACLMGGSAYGRIGEGFGYAMLPDLYGVEAPRFATQAVGIGFALVLFVGFWFLRDRWPFRGASFLMFGLLYFTGQFFLEFTRGDEAIYVGPWRLAQILDLALALVSAAGLLILWWREDRGTEAAEEEGAEEPEATEEGEEPAAPHPVHRPADEPIFAPDTVE
jgi:phosphatidylglycerol:prolipoprotein diacylglycerol transferase